MAELIDPQGYHDFSLEMLKTPDGVTRLNYILRQLAQNLSSDTEAVRIYRGYGTPEASIAAGVGSLYQRVDGTTDTALYKKESGSGNTGWVAISSPASLPLSTANGGLGANASAWTAGNFLYLSSTGVIGHTGAPAGLQIFTSSGTFVAPSGITRVLLTMIAGGGGGCHNNNTGSAGGGSGSWVINYPYTVVGGSSYTVTIGAGGAGGGGVTGSNGTASVFDALSMTGGNGATARTAGGAGTNNFNASGGTGGGFRLSSSGSNSASTTGGAGGGSPFGVGASPPGPAGPVWTGNSAAANTGAGGSGGSGDDGGNQGSGGSGGSGLCIVIY